MAVVELEEKKLGGSFFQLAPPGIEKPRSLTPIEKILLDKQQTLLGAKASHREDQCWSYDCARTPILWVREVQFDAKGEKAAHNHACVSTADYDGPVPGFCLAHTHSGPQELAQTVYFSRPEMYWGFRPNRYFVVFTDDTKQGGSCLQIDPKREMPTIIEEFTHGD